MTARRAAVLAILSVLATVLGPAYAAHACELSSVRAVTADGGARVAIVHDGAVRVRRQPRDDLLVLVLEGCRTAPGAHRVESPPPPLQALRWSWHPDDDAVWVVAELAQGTRVTVSQGEGRVTVTLSRGTGAGGRRWPLGFRVLHPLPEPVRALMARRWQAGCPVPLSELSLVQLTHLGFDGTEKQGDLVVHRDIADEVVDIFAELLRGGCHVERVQLADLYADDDASMAANNSSAYACRSVTGTSDTWSVHSYGRAIDLNPVQNPYVRGDTVLPPAGRDYVSRGRPARGLIRRGDACHRPFASRGWTWGGDFRSLKDYQHFEKPAP